jgi:hypothetical protein
MTGTREEPGGPAYGSGHRDDGLAQSGTDRNEPAERTCRFRPRTWV